MGGGIHTVLMDDEVDWEFNLHPDEKVGNSSPIGN